MSKLDTAVADLVETYDSYFEISEILRGDLGQVLDSSRTDDAWRRDLIRVSWPMIEAYAHAIRSICSSLVKHSGVEVSKPHAKLMRDEASFSSLDRIKESLKLAYKLHDLRLPPKFGGSDWKNVSLANSIRDRVTHPKVADDLRILDDEWRAAHSGMHWLLQRFTLFFEQVNQQYGSAT